VMLLMADDAFEAADDAAPLADEAIDDADEAADSDDAAELDSADADEEACEAEEEAASEAEDEALDESAADDELAPPPLRLRTTRRRVSCCWARRGRGGATHQEEEPPETVVGAPLPTAPFVSCDGRYGASAFYPSCPREREGGRATHGDVDRHARALRDRDGPRQCARGRGGLAEVGELARRVVGRASDDGAGCCAAIEGDNEEEGARGGACGRGRRGGSRVSIALARHCTRMRESESGTHAQVYSNEAGVHWYSAGDWIVVWAKTARAPSSAAPANRAVAVRTMAMDEVLGESKRESDGTARRG